MKRMLFVLALLFLVSVSVPRATRAGVSIDFFYNNLSGGSWIDVDDYGYCWQPDVAASDSSWRPYADGYWAYTDVGWTWISYEEFGWATYHYGRWARLADYGWVWVPGADLEWGPAWVSWRTGGDYVGWAPLPPRGPGVVYQGQPIDAQVDVEFDIGPAYYNFCDVRYLGEPVLRQRIVDVHRNVTYINQTVNVTNITVNNNVVYNYGPDINVINQQSSRPIQRLRLERQENVDVTSAAKSGGFAKVQGNTLVVAAPTKINKPDQSITPPAVKAKIGKAKLEKGWSGVDPNTEAQIKEKLRTEDHGKIPPSTAAHSAASGQPGVSPSPAAPGTPAGAGEFTSGRGKHKGAREERTAPTATSAPSASPTPAVSSAVSREGGGHNGRRGEKSETPAVTSPTMSPQPTAVPGGKPPGESGRGNLGPSPLEATSPGKKIGERQDKHQKHLEQGATQGAQGESAEGDNTNLHGGKHRRPEESATAAPSGGQGAQGAGGSGGKRKAEGANTPAGGKAGSPANQGKGQGKKKGKKASPSPAPQ